MVNRTSLDNLTKGPRPALQTADPTLKGLVARAAQSIADARKKANGPATRFSSAHSAAFRLARVALEGAGFRLAGSEGHRAMVFQCLAHTVAWENPRWRRLDDLHRLRNRFDYGDIVDVSESQVETMIADAQALLDDVQRIFSKAKP